VGSSRVTAETVKSRRLRERKLMGRSAGPRRFDADFAASMASTCIYSVARGGGTPRNSPMGPGIFSIRWSRPMANGCGFTPGDKTETVLRTETAMIRFEAQNIPDSIVENPSTYRDARCLHWDWRVRRAHRPLGAIASSAHVAAFWPLMAPS